METRVMQQSTLVIVDASPGDYMHLLPVIEGQGARIEAFESGEALLRRGLPKDAVCTFISLDLPDGSGIELGRTLHATYFDRMRQTFFVASSYTEEAEVEVLMSGLGAFVVKPIHPKWLHDRVGLRLPQPAGAHRMRRRRERLESLQLARFRSVERESLWRPRTP